MTKMFALTVLSVIRTYYTYLGFPLGSAEKNNLCPYNGSCVKNSNRQFTVSYIVVVWHKFKFC